MRIAQIAPLQVAVPPHGYGGTERVIANLTEGLLHLGHDVTLFASGDSQTSARLIAGVPKALNFDPAVDANAYHIAMLEEVYQHAEDFDIIHSHLDYLTFPFLETVTTPTILTLHGRVDMREFTHVYSSFAKANYVAISDSQRRDQPGINWVATIHHGIDVKSFPFSATSEGYLCFVGRITPEKGPEQAIEIAKRTGIPLKIAAKVDHKDQQYFTQVVEPLLQHPLIEFLGQVDETQKQEIMSHALALVLPIQWPEPFGMVFIEALACGTPVLTCPVGSAPELLRDGITGYIRETVDELVDAAALLPQISREGCRQYAEEHFDLRLMALKYARLYTHLLTNVQQNSLLEMANAAHVAHVVDSSQQLTGVQYAPPTLPSTEQTQISGLEGYTSGVRRTPHELEESSS